MEMIIGQSSVKLARQKNFFNLVLDQLIISLLDIFFILITFLLNIVLICKEKFCRGHS